MSRWYDLIAGSSEWRFVQVGLDLLAAAPGETVLEIGYGTGNSLLALAHAVGSQGHVYGVDISEGMAEIAGERIRRAGLSCRVDLISGDGTTLPFAETSCDAVFISFALELFDTPEIPTVLGECRRVLRRAGRIVVISLAKREPQTLAVRLYEWGHEKMPAILDCRPIYVSESVGKSGFLVVKEIELSMWGLPVAAVLGRKT